MSRTLALLREEGWTCEKTERWNPHAHIRQDLFGFIDVLAFKAPASFMQLLTPPGLGQLLAIQVMSEDTGGHVGSHLAKMRSLPAAMEWVRSGFPLELWSWAKRNGGKRNARKVWTVNRIVVTEEMLEAPAT